MEHRSVGKVIVFSILTLGIYSLVWFFWTTKELKARGADVPTAWLMLVPIVNFYFMWKYFEGAEQVTGGGVNGVLYFLLAFFISPIVSVALAQNEFNKLAGAGPVAAGMPGAAPAGMPQQPMQQPVAPQQPQAPVDPGMSAQQPPVAPEAPKAPQDPNQQPPAAPPAA